MAKVNVEMVRRFAEKVRNLDSANAELNFYSFTKDRQEIIESDKYPSLNASGVVDYFFATTMHNYGFWIGDTKGYVEPLYGNVVGKVFKGSDLLWVLSMNIYRERGAEFFDPRNLAELELYDFCRWIPEEYRFQDILTRYNMTVEYGKYCVRENIDIKNLINIANRSDGVLQSFVSLISSMPGYNEDELFKKNLLLAMIFANRPEKFLKVRPNEKWPPIVDYHLMRVALRLGLISLTWVEWDQIAKRKWVSEWVEAQIREVTFDAVEMVIELSGKSMSEIDFLLWSARKYCPEMTVPDCPRCVFNDVCQKRVELFQPVFRTTNY